MSSCLRSPSARRSSPNSTVGPPPTCRSEGGYRAGVYGFLLRPRWLLGFLGCVALAALCVLAGFWQFDRLDQRRAYNARVVAGREAPPVGVERLPHLEEYRQVR